MPVSVIAGSAGSARLASLAAVAMGVAAAEVSTSAVGATVAASVAGIGVFASGNSSGAQPTAVIATAAAIEPWMNATRRVKVPRLISPSR
jgi:hypothetical protein